MKLCACAVQQRSAAQGCRPPPYLAAASSPTIITSGTIVAHGCCVSVRWEYTGAQTTRVAQTAGNGWSAAAINFQLLFAGCSRVVVCFTAAEGRFTHSAAQSLQPPPMASVSWGW